MSPHKRVFYTVLCAGFLCFASLAACTALTTAPAITPKPIPTAPTATSANVLLLEDVLVLYRKTGGIAGIDETLTVHQGGLVELASRGGKLRRLQVTEPGLLQIRNLLEQKDFAALQPFYRASGADLFTYTITARDPNGNPKTVTTMDTAGHPDYLGLLIVMLDNLRAIVSKNGG